MWFATLSMAIYLLSLLLITPVLLKAQTGEKPQNLKSNFFIFYLTALLAIIFHMGSLQALFGNLVNGHNFSLMEIASLTSVITAILATIAMLWQIRSLWYLIPIVYCFAIINIIFATFIPGHVIENLSQDLGLLIHIALALLAYAICFIATLYAVQLNWIDRGLKRKTMIFSPMIAPLMTVERHFSRILLVGQILLTLTLISGFIYLPNFLAPQNIQKAILTFLAWLVFSILIFGHWKRYWRGKKVLICTISGMILLTMAYFGSRAIL